MSRDWGKCTPERCWSNPPFEVSVWRYLPRAMAMAVVSFTMS